WRQLDMPSPPLEGLRPGGFIAEQGLSALFQPPVASLPRGPSCHQAVLEPALCIELVDRYPIQHSVGLYSIEMHEAIAFAMPQAEFTCPGLIPQCHGAIAVCQLLGAWCHKLCN